MNITFPYYVIDESLRLEASTGLCAALQQQIGTDLPAEFQDFINEYGGIACDGTLLATIAEPCPWGQKARINVFYGFSRDGKYYDLRDTLAMYASRLPNAFLPIAEDPGGNQICLSCSDGSIWFWDHEHREYSSDNLDLMIRELERAGYELANRDLHEIIRAWQQHQTIETHKPDGLTNIYRMADTLEQFIQGLEYHA